MCGGSGPAPEAEAAVPALVVLLVELGGMALSDPLRPAAAVLLGARRLGDQIVPVGGIRRRDPPVAHDERDAIGVELVFEQLERPPQIALPAVGVTGEQEVEATRSEIVEHRDR